MVTSASSCPARGAGEVYALLACEEDDLRSDTGLTGFRFQAFGIPDQRDTIGYEVRLEDFFDEQAQLDWLLDVSKTGQLFSFPCRIRPSCV